MTYGEDGSAAAAGPLKHKRKEEQGEQVERNKINKRGEDRVHAALSGRFVQEGAWTLL